jgi:CoA:oxalate CoA-transferase
MIAERLVTADSGNWIKLLEQEGLWVMEVLNWQEMKNEEAYQVLKMEQEIVVDKKQLITTRCPVRINGKRIYSQKGAPKLGQHTESIKEELIKAL